MRSDASEVKSKGSRARSLSGSSRGPSRKSVLRRLAIEGLESRTLLASQPTPTLSALPAPTVQSGTLADISNSEGNESSPTIAIDKNNPLKMAAVWVRNDPKLAPGVTIFVEGATSNDGGLTWTSLGFLGILPDPTTSSPIKSFGEVTDPSVAFDRNDNFYVLDLQHNSALAAPTALALSKFNFSGSSPTSVFSNEVVYESLQNPVVSPVLAVDDNLPSSKDTDTFGNTYTQTDQFAGDVYIAWGTNNVVPKAFQNDPFYNPNEIELIASSDGGQNFSGPVTIDSRGNNGTQHYTSPQLVISQGRPKDTALFGAGDQGVPGGQVSLVYDDFGTLSQALPVPEDIIWSNHTQGASSQVFSGQTGPINIATPNTAPPVVNSFTNSVTINSSNFTSLSDLSVYLTVTHPTDANLQIVLVPPTGSGLPAVTLVQAGTLSGANLGIATDGIAASTILSDHGPMAINDGTSTNPYMGIYQPESSLDGAYAGATAAQLSGTWTLQITDTKNGNVGAVNAWSLHFLGGMSPGQENEVTTTDVRGALGGVYPLKPPASPNVGVGPGAVIASDNTLGAFSPNEGKLYVAYVDHIYNNGNNPAANTDIYLRTSSDGGQTWSAPVLVNDDNATTDGFSESTSNGSDPRGVVSGRTQYEPEVAVDDTTGTLVLSWLDARNDAANARVATYLTASLDGGQTFSPQVFANPAQTAVDAITKQTVNLGPIPDNESGGNPNTDATFGFGSHQGLAVFGGKVIPAWSSNLNGGVMNNGVYSAGDGKALLDIRTVVVDIPAGPRIIASTMGPIGLPGDTVNPQTPNAPTPVVSAFQVTFDRPVDPGTFTAADVEVFYRDTTPNNVSGGPVPVKSVIPIPTPNDPNNPNNVFGFTQFQVNFAPRTGVGTYSYIVLPNIQDRIRSQSIQVTPVGSPTVFTAVGPQVPVNISNQFTTDSTIPVSVPVGQVVSNVTVKLTIDFPNNTFPTFPLTEGLTVSLIAPDGTTVILSQNEPSTFTTLSGNNGFINTVFDDSALKSIGDPTAGPPYTGSFKPESPLAELLAHNPNGNWTLQVQNDFFGLTGATGILENWSMTIQTGVAAQVIKPGNSMDQNADGVPGEQPQSGVGIGDAYAAPFPTSSNLAFTAGQFFPGPYNQDTLPLIVPGPHVVSSHVPGAPTTTDNLVTNATVNSIDVTFDRDMDPTTFTPASVLSIMGPTGAISLTGITITPNPLGTDPNPNFPRTYRITFPAQQLDGTYTVTLASSIKSEAGDSLDTNLNAGVDLLKQTPGQTSTPVTFASQLVPAGITPGQTTTSVISVPSGFLAQGVQLALTINYPNDPDLEATLIGPDGVTQVKLFTNVGAPNGNPGFNGTVFDDTASTPIQDGGPPFFGRFIPQEPLSTFNGTSAGGNWTLEIKDDATGSTTTPLGSLISWSLTFQKSVPISGLGEPVADQATVSFRIFDNDPTNPLTSQTWAPVGPASTTNNPPTGSASGAANGYAGTITSIAVDPSDPSGNTVYVTGAGGGIWKTTDFLTTSPAGPTYIPLTDFAPSFGLNIGSIAVFGRNNDPNQSIIIAGTGNANAIPGQGGLGGNTSQGIGFLRSEDGGATWTLLDSTDNTLPFASRDHLFAASGGTSTFRVVVDPRPTLTGQVIVYAAMGGPNGGLWRSLDTGDTWQKMSTAAQGNVATDVILDLNSGTVDAISNPTGNVNVIYAAFQGNGVYISPNRGQTLNLMTGGGVDPLIRDPSQIVNGQPRSITVNNGTFPTGQGDRITLAKPALVPSTDPLADTENLLYEGWLYAVISDTSGHIIGLYLTKDDGTTWTQIHTGTLPSVNNAIAEPSNNPTQPVYDTIGAASSPYGNYSISLTVDPTDPNIVYLGGTSVGQTSGLIRIDATGLYDSHADVGYDGSRPDGGLVQLNTTGRAAVKNVNNGPPQLVLPTSSATQFLDLIQDPPQPFLTDTTLYLFNVQDFTNDGSGITWIPFDQMLNAGPNDLLPSTSVHQLISYVDPLTGHARLIAADDQGVFTAVDQGNGTLSPGIGTAVSPTFSRNGDLQVSQFYYGASQPSTVAAQIAGALFYGNGLHTGIGASNPGELTPGNAGSGNTNWSSPTADGNNNTSGVLDGELDGTGVQTSQQGGMTDPLNPSQKLPTLTYQYAFPGLGGAFSDFFQVSTNGGPFISRTQGLVQVANDPQWPIAIPDYPAGVVPGNFAVNPIDGDEVIISSNAGRIFSTINQGKLWLVIGNPTDLDGTYAPALAYGAPDPSAPGGVGNLNNFIYAGTIGGHIYVTTTGGGGSGNSWTNISTGLDGSAVLKIVTDPTRGSHAAYAVTEKGVYYTPNSLNGGGWTNITGNLFNILLSPFGNANLANNAVQYLTSIAADWRYAIPNSSGVSGGATHPVLYVSSESGVYRSLDNGTTWTIYPDNTPTAGSSATLPPAGGLLPDAHVTDLSLAIGNIDPTTGRPIATAGDPNNLVATTLGRGAFTIRLAPIVFPNTATQSSNIHLDPTLPAPTGSVGGTASDGVTPLVTIPQPFIDGVSEQTAFGNTVFISFFDLTNPSSPRLIGGFDPSNPATAIVANETNAAGQFSIQINKGAFTFNGTKVIGIQATDASGTKGNMATFTFVLNANLPLPNPPTVPTIALSPFDDSSHGQNITNVTQPHVIGTTDPNTAVALFLSSGGKTTGTALASGTSDANGNFTLQFPTPLAPGVVTVQVVATNTFGSSTSAVLTFTIKTQGPTTAPTLGLLATDDSGIKGDGITSVRNPHFVGKTDPNAIVDIYNANNTTTPLAETTADASGNYSVQLPFNLNDGTITLEARARDVAGNVGPIGSPFTVHIVTVRGDYSGNGQAQLALYERTVPATWLIQGVTSPSGTSFGIGTQDIPLQGDFTGSGQNQLAVYDPSTATWYIQGLFPFPSGVQFGEANVDLPAPADYFGTGVTNVATYRPTTGQWFVGGSSVTLPTFGGPNDLPVPGDYDGVGHAEQAVYRPATGQFFIGGHSQPITLGSPNEVPVPGFYDNTTTSRRMEPAVYNPVTGVMTILGPNNVVRTYQFAPGSIPAPNDYDGVGMDEPAAFNPTAGTWAIYAPGSTTPKTVSFGALGEVPVAAPYGYRKLPVKGDYIGAGSAQEALYQPSTAQFLIGGGVGNTTFGAPNSIPLQGDFSGIGKTELASYNPSTATWYVQGLYPNGVQFGAPGVDIPVPGNYNSSGIAQLAVWRPTTGQWFIAGAGGVSATLGQQGDIPVPGNYDHTGEDEFAVFRPSTDQWLIDGPSGTRTIGFGGSGDIPIPGNYDGYGFTQLAVFRPSTDQWFVAGDQPITFGGPGDIPAPGDYHGVGHLEIAVYRPSTGQLFVAGYAQPLSLGNSQDVPVNSPLAYRTPGSSLGAASVSTTGGNLDFAGQAATMSNNTSSSTPSTPAPSSSKPQVTASSTPPVTNTTGHRPNQALHGQRSHIVDIALASLGRFGKHRRG